MVSLITHCNVNKEIKIMCNFLCVLAGSHILGDSLVDGHKAFRLGHDLKAVQLLQHILLRARNGCDLPENKQVCA